MSYLRYLCLFAYMCVQQILCYVFLFCFVCLRPVSCVIYCIVFFCFVLFVFVLCLVYSGVEHILHWVFFISRLSSSCVPNVVSFCGLCILDCPFGLL
jgi:hypothetical protein